MAKVVFERRFIFDHLNTLFDKKEKLLEREEGFFTKIEPRNRKADYTEAMSFEVYDPLWMLGRQRQFGRFQGNNCGTTVQTNLFDDEDPIGRTIRIGAMPFKVVGVLAAKGANSWGQDQDDTVMAPYTTVGRVLQRSKFRSINMMNISLWSLDDNDEAKREVTALFTSPLVKVGDKDGRDKAFSAESDPLEYQVERRPRPIDPYVRIESALHFLSMKSLPANKAALLKVLLRQFPLDPFIPDKPLNDRTLEDVKLGANLKLDKLYRYYGKRCFDGYKLFLANRISFSSSQVNLVP